MILMQIKSVKHLACSLGWLLCQSAMAQQIECITEAARCFQINPLVIKAIIWQESKNQQQALNKNSNNTVDVGIMQINTVHFKSLAARGIDKELLLQNSCANVFSGAWILKQSIKHYGYTWQGIGNYHSKTPVHHNRYVKNIIALIAHQTPVINKIEVVGQAYIRKRFSC